MTAKVIDLHGVLLAVLAIVLLPELVWPDAALYREVLTDAVMLPAGALLKIALQASAVIGAWSCAARFDAGDRTRRSWRLLALAMALFAVGQIVLAWWQVWLREPAPFPSPADACFVPATILLALALIDFADAHAEAGLGVGSRAQAFRISLVVIVLAGGVLAWPLAALWSAAQPFAERAMAMTYPILDIALLAPAIVVLRQIRRLRGGLLWFGWWVMLVGVVALAVGDVAFAVFSVLEVHRLDPLLDFAFASGYLMIGWGTRVSCRVIG
jgi:hypothetical protein